jgi:hypothetical protein
MAAHNATAVRRGLLSLALAAMAFQAAHLFEHFLQAGYWVAHPTGMGGGFRGEQKTSAARASYLRGSWPQFMSE